MQTLDEYDKLIVIEDGCVRFPEHGDYEIELKRIPTPEALLAWVVHMTEKTWFDGIMANQFILRVAHHQKMKIPWTV